MEKNTKNWLIAGAGLVLGYYLSCKMVKSNRIEKSLQGGAAGGGTGDDESAQEGGSGGGGGGAAPSLLNNSLANQGYSVYNPVPPVVVLPVTSGGGIPISQLSTATSTLMSNTQATKPSVPVVTQTKTGPVVMLNQKPVVSIAPATTSKFSDFDAAQGDFLQSIL